MIDDDDEIVPVFESEGTIVILLLRLAVEELPGAELVLELTMTVPRGVFLLFEENFFELFELVLRLDVLELEPVEETDKTDAELFKDTDSVNDCVLTLLVPPKTGAESEVSEVLFEVLEPTEGFSLDKSFVVLEDGSDDFRDVLSEFGTEEEVYLLCLHELFDDRIFVVGE